MPKVEPPKPRPVAKPVPTPAAPAAQKPASKPVVKTQAVATSNFYVQFGSYGTRAGAESAQKKIAILALWIIRKSSIRDSGGATAKRKHDLSLAHWIQEFTGCQWILSKCKI